ncbi:MAG: ribosome-associated translation inhibitor RaiA [Candidatus Paceibacterota bacterium]
MNIRTKATNITLTPAITEYLDKHIRKIVKLVGSNPAIQCDVELARTSDHHQKGEIFRAEIHILGAGIDAYASSEAEDLYRAIDGVRSEILHELNNRKDKRQSAVRRGGARVKAIVKGLMPWGEDGWYKRRSKQ